MAAGVGEASAILTIAQLGISLSNSLISYIGEVQDAPFRIQRISNEVATTCERLRDIGQLVDKNHETHIFSEEGIHSAVRCSEECHKIIGEVKTVLRKGGWQQRSGALEKDEIDTSLFSTLRWPFLKRSLEVPRAELQRIKVDLSLLFSSAMALGASNAADKAKFCMDIPGLQRTREWAARMETRARQRAQNRHPDYPPSGPADDMYWVDDEPEVLQEFVVYQERRMREEEDRKAMARAALLQAEQEKKTKIEEEARREIEREAVDAYKRNQIDMQTRTQERKETFRNELSRLRLQPSQINLIVDDSNLNFGDNGTDATAPTIRPIDPRNLSSGSTAIQSHGESVEDNKKVSATPSTRGTGRRKFSCEDHSSHDNFVEQEGTTNQNNAAWMTPRTISRSSNLKSSQAQNDILPQKWSTQMQPKVTFASEVDQVLENVPTVRSSQNLRRFRDADEMRKAIARLGETKRKLGPADEDRIDEINDMIILLAAQLKLHSTLSWSQQEDWYYHIEKDRPFRLSYELQGALRDQTEENVLPRDYYYYRNQPLRRNDRDFSAVPQYDERYPTHVIRRESAVPEPIVIERFNTRRPLERSRPQMSHYLKDDYGLSNPERSTTIQRERVIPVIPSQPPPRQEQIRPSKDQRPVDNSTTGEDIQRILTPGITRASTFNDDWERPANENRALVLRKGGSHQTVGEVLDCSIRVRGEDVAQSPTDEYYSATSYRVPESGPSSYADRSLPFVSRQATMESEPANVDRYGQFQSGYSSKAYVGRGGRKPLHREIERVKDRGRRRRSPRHAVSSTSSDDDDYPPLRERSSSRSESRLSDQQLITKTLQRYTTFQSDKLPVTQISSELTLPRDDPLRSRPKDHQGHDALNGETQNGLAGAPSQSVLSNPSAVTTTGEIFSGIIKDPDSSYVEEIIEEKVYLPSFNVPRRNSRDVNHAYYPPVALNRHTDGNRGNPATETSTQSTSETGEHEAREALQEDVPREPRISESSDASSDAGGRRTLRRQGRQATIEDAEADQD